MIDKVQELAELQVACKVLRKAGLRDTLPYWILTHAKNRVELEPTEFWLRMSRHSRDTVRSLNV